MRLGKIRFIAPLCILASTIFQPASIWGVTIRDDQPDTNYLALAASPEYAPVGTFVNSWGYTGSGTLIAPDWVLLAAHELIAASSGTFTINSVPYASTQLILYPDWSNGSPFAGYDIGLVHLSTPVPGVTPATLYTGSSDFGQVGTFVGFGFTGTGLTGWRTLDNQKRAFQNDIDGDFGNPSILLASDFDNPYTTADSAYGDASPLALEGCVAPGDSGGGVFITIDSQTYLAGVIAFVANTDGNGNSDYGDISGFGRVSAFAPWITGTIPEPPASTLLAGAGLVMLLGRQWRRVKKSCQEGQRTQGLQRLNCVSLSVRFPPSGWRG
ncbi:MAG: trypsin-like serine protease [Verrucomicrobiota bacterium]